MLRSHQRLYDKVLILGSSCRRYRKGLLALVGPKILWGFALVNLSEAFESASESKDVTGVLRGIQDTYLYSVLLESSIGADFQVDSPVAGLQRDKMDRKKKKKTEKSDQSTQQSKSFSVVESSTLPSQGFQLPKASPFPTTWASCNRSVEQRVKRIRNVLC